MYRFVLSLRWLGFALFVILLAGVCVRLGNWQHDRHEQRKADNEIISAHLDESPRPIDDVLGSDDDSVPDDIEWTPVTVTGTYDTEREVVEKYQTRDEGPGVDVVTPLVTDSGIAVIVDRGWMSSPNNSAEVDIPAPPSGKVTVTGWLRVDSAAEASAVEPTDGQVRAVSSTGMEAALPYDAYPGFVNRTDQDPAGDDGLEPEPRPDLGQGPHFFYAMQWYFFAGLAVFGWFYFAWSEAHPRTRRANRETPAEPATDRDGADAAS
ncbi:SURF1 family cytochrome oxidase biogenesis protein [Solicola gregarius]|uniref:SURF1-like protein n=1 Tax=Solicola gregarius TaxID=2908642 RepID=A0AA46TGW5_9ACTN|nr:SURF1 family protein [Solicola gregarius]UYM04968.1 SURF1 family protein [Solicola gregarius]